MYKIIGADGQPYGPAVTKETDRIAPVYRKLIEAAPFVAVATGGPDGLDCSPKGDAPGFVRVLDDKTLALPDRPGNNRIDGFRNLLKDPRIALLFLIPTEGENPRAWGIIVCGVVTVAVCARLARRNWRLLRHYRGDDLPPAHTAQPEVRHRSVHVVHRQPLHH